LGRAGLGFGRVGRTGVGRQRLGRPGLGGAGLGEQRLGRPRVGVRQVGGAGLGLAHRGVTDRVTRTGRRGLTPAAGAARAWLGDPILRRVAPVLVLGLVSAAAVSVLLPGRESVFDPHLLAGPWLWPGLVVLVCAGELIAVRLRHGEAVEELSLYEAAVIVVVLLLPPVDALAAAATGLLLASVLQRRPLVKAVFNLGSYTASAAAMIAVVHLVGGTPGHSTPRVVAAVLLGTTVFTAINLCCLAQILAVVDESSPWQIIRSEARLSAYIAVGTVATGLPTAQLALHAPELVPFMAMPALAVTYAYRAAAQEIDTRARSAVLLQLSHALAERDDVVRRFLLLFREAFGADRAVVVLDRAELALSVDAGCGEEVRTGPVPPVLTRLVGLVAPMLVKDGLPVDVRQLLVVPLESGGRRFGVVALVMRRHTGGLAQRRGRRRLSAGDLAVVAPLASALAAAMRGAEHLDRLVEETSKLHAVVDQSTEGILMVDGDGVVQMWSRALAELTGITAAAASGVRLTELFDIPDPGERGLLLPVTAEQPVAAAVLTIRRPDGELRRLRLAHSAAFDGGTLVRDVVVVSDLTREARTERLKSDFIATVSHELRTPLTPIIGYVDLLRTRGDRMTPQKRRDSLDLIADRAGHLLRLVEDLLLASRISEAGGDLTMHVSPGVHDLAALVRQVTGDLGSSRLVVDLPDGPVRTRCDEGRTRQVVANLVGNALKYSPESAEVLVDLAVDGDHVRVRVTDHGQGIPADQLTKVFEKFHRVEDPMTMSTSGTGLGLFISRRLAQAMDGDIAVTSALNVGSVFTLTLLHADAKDGSVSADGQVDTATRQVHAVR
jgi:PAS domain S-box-containing protein